MRITVTENGPYLVSGGVPLIRAQIVTNAEGESVGWREVERIAVPFRYALCRCGASQMKPFCDGAHELTGFDGTETASTDDYSSAAADIDGPGVKLHDVRALCAEARFCDRAGGLWNLVKSCDDQATRELAREEAMLCPSGRYVFCDEETGRAHEPDFEPSIVLVEDPSMGVSGPLFVRGGIPVFSADGNAYEVRNRVTLCRCGRSGNKPFCDGSHIAAKFHDEGATAS
ncbi:MAG: iron-binding protein [Actinobacteria bacterium HGW-Actinobacteria-7]|nr:MAG: iron-binding protein [Actinobacteria bacterium HGW-Actinobacteria-7]